MPAERIKMRKIREVLRLKYELGLTKLQVVTSCNIGMSSVKRYLRRAREVNLSWPLPVELDDAALELLLYPSEERFRHELPDLQHIHQELKRKGVTLYLLWEEYKSKMPNGISYSRFCQIYRDFKNKLPIAMRQEHKAGEKVFVDYAGLTLPYVDRDTGEVLQVQIFVGVPERFIRVSVKKIALLRLHEDRIISVF